MNESLHEVEVIAEEKRGDRLNFIGPEDEVRQKWANFIDSIVNLDAGALREDQIDAYKGLISKVLNINVSEFDEHDPFREVTGIPLAEMARKRYPLNDQWDRIFAAETALSSDDLYVYSHKRGDITCSNNFFDPVNLIPRRQWDLKFGFVEIFHNSRHWQLNQGIVQIPDGVIDILKTIDSEQMVDSLHEIYTWFNHDLTAHALFLPGGDIGTFAFHYGNDETNELVRSWRTARDLTPAGGVPGSAGALEGELWSGSLHQALYRVMVERRGAIDRFLRMHLKRYIKEVETATSSVKPDSLREDLVQYLINAYSFAFFRLVDPNRLDEEGDLHELKVKYPYLNELGDFEKKIQRHFHDQKGLMDSEAYEESAQEPKQFSHKNVVELWGTAGDQYRSLEDFYNYMRGMGSVEKQKVREHLQVIPEVMFSEWVADRLRNSIRSRMNIYTISDFVYGKVKEIVSNNREEIIDLVLKNGLKMDDLADLIVKKLSEQAPQQGIGT